MRKRGIKKKTTLSVKRLTEHGNREARRRESLSVRRRKTDREGGVREKYIRHIGETERRLSFMNVCL